MSQFSILCLMMSEPCLVGGGRISASFVRRRHWHRHQTSSRRKGTYLPMFNHDSIYHTLRYIRPHTIPDDPPPPPLWTTLPLVYSPPLLFQCTSLLIALGRDEEVKSLRKLMQALQGYEGGQGLEYDPSAAMMWSKMSIRIRLVYYWWCLFNIDACLILMLV